MIVTKKKYDRSKGEKNEEQQSIDGI